MIAAGVGVVVTRGDAVALGRRLSPRPCWSLPGGKIEPLESVIDCARRELYEETGLRAQGEPRVSPARALGTSEFRSLTYGVRFPGCAGELILREPDKFSAWDWFPLWRLPDELFLPTRVVLDQFLGAGSAR